jgi:(R,R)-butanediol dehydrogenase/meso-butanediol dehydrogenase/diacetyl reductase
VPAYQPHARPPELSIEVAALVEPLAVSVHGWRLAGVEQPDSVVIVGIGNIGLLAILVARARGARQIIAIGKYAARQELALAYGASVILEPDDPQCQARILERTNGLGAAPVLEAAGTPSSLKTAVAVARKGGKIVILGVFHEEIVLNVRMVQLMEKHLLGSLIYQHQDFADAIHILAGGGIEKGRHITAEIPLHDIVSHGFVPLSEQRAAHIKIEVYPHV